MTKAQDLQARYEQTYLNVFGSPKLVLERGAGSYVFDVDGKRYLDYLGGVAVNCLGHAHPRVAAAVAAQAAQLMHVSNFFTTPQQVALSERIVEVAQAPAGSAVFLCNSGAEANEAAMKLARRTGRAGFVVLDHAFHGRTMGALTLTAKEAYRAPFEPLVPGVLARLPMNDAQALRAAFARHGDSIGAFIVEPVQGEAGVFSCDHAYLQLARQLTSEHGALLIVDEVQTGIGRTGTWFGFQHSRIVPDAITLAKGLGGGFPIGALVTFGAEVTSLLSPGQHGSTFGGNPLACAAGLAVLDVLSEPDALSQVEAKGAYLESKLSSAPGVAQVRRAGLLLGVQLAEGLDAGQLVADGLAAGVILNAPRPDTIRLAPSLLISQGELDELIDLWPQLVREQRESASVS